MTVRRAWAGRVCTSGDPLRIAIGISGTGSNMLAILDAIDAGLPVACVLVFADRADARGLAAAAARGVRTCLLDPSAYPSRTAYQQALADILVASGAELVCLAGFMRLVTEPLLAAFPDCVLNIHPSLLPAFPGLDAQKQAWDHGVKVSGCTVHFVTLGMDEGPIALQAPVPVGEGDSWEDLRERILVEEHRIYPEALRLFAAGQLYIEGRRVHIR